MKYNVIDYKWILLILIFGIFIACNQSSDNQENQDNENTQNIEENQDNTEEPKSDINNLEEKMDEIMTESNEDQSGNHKDVTIIKAGGAKQVEVKVKIGAGKLKLSSGSSELFTGGFIFTEKDWKPEVNYKVISETGYLSVKQPDSENYNMNDNDKYAWNLKFAENIPLDFDIELGAGMSEIYLDNLQVSHFAMNMGVGRTEIDLHGRWKKSTDIHLDGGIGLSVIHIPKDVGVILNVEKGLGSIEVKNMNRNNGSEYVNDSYGKSNITLKIYLKTGIGKIEVD